jgi:hypothetical protein
MSPAGKTRGGAVGGRLRIPDVLRLRLGVHGGANAVLYPGRRKLERDAIFTNLGT